MPAEPHAVTRAPGLLQDMDFTMTGLEPLCPLGVRPPLRGSPPSPGKLLAVPSWKSLDSPVSFQGITQVQQRCKCSLSWVHLVCTFALQLLKCQPPFTGFQLISNSVSASQAKRQPRPRATGSPHLCTPQPSAGSADRRTGFAPCRQPLVLALANHHYILLSEIHRC